MKGEALAKPGCQFLVTEDYDSLRSVRTDDALKVCDHRLQPVSHRTLPVAGVALLRPTTLLHSILDVDPGCVAGLGETGGDRNEADPGMVDEDYGEGLPVVPDLGQGQEMGQASEDNALFQGNGDYDCLREVERGADIGNSRTIFAQS